MSDKELIIYLQFGEESSHLRCLNPFIIECHERMKELFRKCCRGPTLEEYFAVDEYTEATLLNHPHIYITVQVTTCTEAQARISNVIETILNVKLIEIERFQATWVLLANICHYRLVSNVIGNSVTVTR